MSSAPYKYEYEYEYHTMRDAALPIMYHEERLPSGYGILTNWHENLEILWFTKGLGRVIIDNVQVDAEPGDLVFINSNCLHRILSIEDVAYYCLIIDRSFCLRSGIPAEKVRIQPRIRDGILRGNYKQIIRVLEEKPPYCEAEAQANILFDAAVTDFLHEETVVCLASWLVQRLTEESGLTPKGALAGQEY